MDWADLGRTVASAAPLLGGVVGGPLGAGIGGIIASAFGVEANPTDISAAIKADPQSAVKLREIELNHKADLERIILDTAKAELADKQNARENHRHSMMPAILSLALSLVIVAIIYLLFYSEPPEGSRDVLFMVLGVVIKEWGGSMQYWFGTTRSSAEKNRTINTK